MFHVKRRKRRRRGDRGAESESIILYTVVLHAIITCNISHNLRYRIISYHIISYYIPPLRAPARGGGQQGLVVEVHPAGGPRAERAYFISLSLSLYIYIYMYVCVYIYIYICIYTHIVLSLLLNYQ